MRRHAVEACSARLPPLAVQIRVAGERGFGVKEAMNAQQLIVAALRQHDAVPLSGRPPSD